MRSSRYFKVDCDTTVPPYNYEGAVFGNVHKLTLITPV